MSYPLWQSGAQMNERHDMKLSNQIEMSMNTKCRPLVRRQRRLSRASWWFAQMRRAVDANGDCGAEPAQARDRGGRQELLPLLPVRN